MSRWQIKIREFRRLSRLLTIAAILPMLCAANPVQQDKNTRKQSPGKAQSQSTFKLPVNVIVVNVTAADKDGNPVTDINQNELKIYDDGKLQDIQTFALESYRPVKSESEELQKPALARTGSPVSETVRPRMISILIDDITTESNDNYPRIVKAVDEFVEKDLGPLDQVAIMSGSGRVRFPFSDDKGTLREEAGVLYKKLNVNRSVKSECPELTALQAQGIFRREDQDALDLATRETIECMNLDPNDENQKKVAERLAIAAADAQHQETDYRNRTLLNVLRQHIRSLGHFEAAKSVVLFSEGFLSLDISYELEDVADQALHSGVVLNTIDVRGLYTYTPSASERAALSQSNFSSRQRAVQDDAFAKESPLNQLASDTGGLFHHNTNDLYEGLQKVSDRTDCYYVLTYAMPPMKPDGRYHRIKVETSRPGVNLTYRKGYYSPKEELTFERRKKEDILEALQAPGNLNEIPIRLAYNYYQEDDSTYSVSLTTNVTIRGLHFLDEDSRRKNLISIVVVALDETDRFMDGLEKTIDFRLTEASYASLLNYGLNSKAEFKLPLGRYKIKAVVRESTQGKMGSETKAIEIP